MTDRDLAFPWSLVITGGLVAVAIGVLVGAMSQESSDRRQARDTTACEFDCWKATHAWPHPMQVCTQELVVCPDGDGGIVALSRPTKNL